VLEKGKRPVFRLFRGKRRKAKWRGGHGCPRFFCQAKNLEKGKRRKKAAFRRNYQLHVRKGVHLTIGKKKTALLRPESVNEINTSKDRGNEKHKGKEPVKKGKAPLTAERRTDTKRKTS